MNLNLSRPDDTLSNRRLANNSVSKANNKLIQSPPSFSLSRSPIVSSDGKPSPVAKPKPKARRKKRQPWSKEEDTILFELVSKERSYKPNWSNISSQLIETIDTDRTGKQCRERWQNHLRPNIKKGGWTAEEEEMIRTLYHQFGPKWTGMSKLMKNRTDNDIKNKWNSMVRTQRLNEARYGYSSNSNSNNCSLPWRSVLQSGSSASASATGSPATAIGGPGSHQRFQKAEGRHTEIVHYATSPLYSSAVRDESKTPNAKDNKNGHTSSDPYNWVV